MTIHSETDAIVICRVDNGSGTIIPTGTSISDEREVFSGFRYLTPHSGWVCRYASASCAGKTIRVIASGDIFTASCQELGSGIQVEIANGSLGIAMLGDVSSYLIIERVGLTISSGTVECVPVLGNNLAGDDWAAGDPYGESIRSFGIRNDGEDSVVDLRFWSPPLGTPRELDSSTGLGASGAGVIGVSSTSDWHPNVRFAMITGSGQDMMAPVEIVCGYIEGDTFVVPVYGRGLLGTTPAATVTGQYIVPWSGIRLEITDSTAPSSWSYLLSEDDATDIAIIASSTKLLHVHYPFPSDMQPSEAVPVALSWSFTSNAIKRTQNAISYFRVSNNILPYMIRKIVDGGSPIDSEYSALPVTVVSLTDDAMNEIEVYKQDVYGGSILIGKETFNLNASGEVILPITAPRNVEFGYNGSGDANVTGYYSHTFDASPGDSLTITITDGTTPTTVTGVTYASSGRFSYTADLSGYSHGTTLTASAKVVRSGDGEESDAVDATLVVDKNVPDTPVGMGWDLGNVKGGFVRFIDD